MIFPKRLVLALFSFGAILPMLTLSGCLVSSSSNVSHSGTYVSDVTLNQIVDGKTDQSWVGAVLGPPTTKTELQDGTELWKWSYSKRTDSSGAIFLVFGGSSSEEQHGNVYIEMKGGIVTRHWRD